MLSTGASGPALRDRITLSGITATGFHGVFPHERRDGQPFVVDLVLFTDLGPAAATDDLTLTAHYGEVAERVVQIITGEPLNLIEALAARIADAVLASFSVLAAVEVTVHKPKAPITVQFGDVAVTIHRERA
ncbi:MULTISPECIES: dihydroneopterin aldolase [Arthrobacter]|uniref:7,8-dihydroneopterin aldolase n=1 Tax=Arthrobacter jinronghuae TaxID=2964609 RepID=A0ABT1NL24_9MICC|nr:MULTISPECIES: dihydroneopterin aldolase [Arthrobacter]MCQ1948430.1 dihydroneopterin aldolase [Arthrobacter jinronghuae]MCQ1951755.1 dihydroneopterin aldolase [Arthrobacter sp. zg-Y238]MCQ1956107.1 dihydroneopterin aldolase [Arthrobacter jinronghuae]UWX78741.1 dihydroneopterin aldolase [Arthrobacter jinronghuae]